MRELLGTEDLGLPRLHIYTGGSQPGVNVLSVGQGVHTTQSYDRGYIHNVQMFIYPFVYTLDFFII